MKQVVAPLPLLLFNEVVVAVASSEQSLILGTAARSSGGISQCIVGKPSTMEKETTERIEAMEILLESIGECSCCISKKLEAPPTSISGMLLMDEEA